MKQHIILAHDARQTRQWGEYLQAMGWRTEVIDTTYLFIKRIPFINASFIKIQHPQGPLLFEKIDKCARKNNALWMLIEPHAAYYDEKEYIQHGYQKSKILQAHTATIKIDLTQQENDLFKSFSDNAKRNIKKSQKENLEVRIIFMKEKKNWKYFDVFYSLLVNLGKMKQFYVPSYNEYYKKMTAFKNTSLLMFAYEKNKPIGVVWYVCFDNVIAYFQTGIAKRGYETLANYLLVWEGLLLGKKLGLAVFDFESIFDPRYPKNVVQYKKYTEFKTRFHGNVIEYPSPWIKIYSWWGKILYSMETL